MLPSDAAVKLRVERSFLGLDAQENVVRLPESTLLLVVSEENPDGFVEVQSDGRSLRVLAIDLALRTVRLNSALS